MNDETEPAGATPEDDISGLLLIHLTSRDARNAAELELVNLAYKKHIYRARRKPPNGGWLTDAFIRRVHFDMLGTIWEWAGKYRTAEVNIGIDWRQIPEQVRILSDDLRYWNSDKCSMEVIEIAARLQNRLTWIHPFKNGNGRHARLITDIFFYSQRHRLPRWPQIQLITEGDSERERYIAAMKDADEGDYTALIQFIDACLDRKT